MFRLFLAPVMSVFSQVMIGASGSPGGTRTHTVRVLKSTCRARGVFLVPLIPFYQRFYWVSGKSGN